jgi:hypothetical protein
MKGIVAASARGTRGCELQGGRIIVGCIRYLLAKSSCTERFRRSSSLLSDVPLHCKTHARQAWPLTRIDSLLYLGALLRLARQ